LLDSNVIAFSATTTFDSLDPAAAPGLVQAEFTGPGVWGFQWDNAGDLDGDGWPEYSGTAETSPPYPVALRGMEVRIRCYEPHSKQVRQITLRHSFPR
jgi:hypothetical protein